VAKCTYSKHLLIPSADRALRHIGRAPMQICTGSDQVLLHDFSVGSLSPAPAGATTTEDVGSDLFGLRSLKRSSSRLRVSSGSRFSSLLCDCEGCAVIKILLGELRRRGRRSCSRTAPFLKRIIPTRFWFYCRFGQTIHYRLLFCPCIFRSTPKQRIGPHSIPSLMPCSM
jgi:hypothetical protein